MHLLLPLMIFVSGCAALVYELAWIRMLYPVFGLSIYSVSIVLATFLGGLGLGSYFAPDLVRRFKGNLLVLYGSLEFGIAAASLLVPMMKPLITTLFVALAPYEASGSTLWLIKFLLSSMSMLPVTFLMGLTVPCLVVVMEEQAVFRGKPVIAMVYGVNTLGGMTGVFLAGFWLMWQFGLQNTHAIAMGLNIIVACTAFILSRSLSAYSAEAPLEQQAGREQSDGTGASYGYYLLLFALAGFAALSYELIWTRLLVFFLQSSTYSFAIILLIFLFGIGIGSLLHSWFAARRTLDLGQTMMLAALCQVGIAGYNLAAIYLYTNIDIVWAALLSILGSGSWEVVLLQKAIITSLIALPSTLIMGFSFPVLASILYKKGFGAGEAIGRLYGANTAGTVLGILLTGLFLFDTIGVQSSLLMMSVINLVIACIFALSSIRTPSFYRTGFAAIAVVTLTLAVLMPGDLVYSNYEKYKQNILYFNEHASDIVMVHEGDTKGDGKPMRELAFHDGRGTCNTSLAWVYLNKQFAFSAMAHNPAAKDVLVISMGCGNTAAAFTAFPIDRLDIVDISPGAFEAAEFFPTNDGVMDNPLVHPHVEDGRNYLLRTNRQYDVIELEPPSIHTDGVVNLYTREFYELAWSRLKPGGVLSQWIHSSEAGGETTKILVNTMLSVFPNATGWDRSGITWVNAVKSDEPIDLRAEEVRNLFALPRVQQELKSVDSDFEDMLTLMKYDTAGVTEYAAGQRIIDDNQTWVDFAVPRQVNPGAFGGGMLFYNSPLKTLFQDAQREKSKE